MEVTTQIPPKLYPHDHLMKYLVLSFIPAFVRPNHVTALRMIMTPVVLWLLLVENYVVAVPLFVFVAFTDAIDGSLARIRNQITPWGIFFDPVADKLLIGSVAILVALRYFHPLIVFTAIILDILPSIRWASANKTSTIMMANVWGKTKMLLQVSSLTLLLVGIMLSMPILITIGEALLVVSLLFSLIAVITYSL